MKTLKASERNEEQRHSFREQQAGLESVKLRIVDESGAGTAMTRRYGWAAHNQRCEGYAPRNWGKNLTVLTTLTLAGIAVETTIYFEGGLTGVRFESYMVEILLPHLRTGEIIILDNLSALLSARVEEEFGKKECKLLYLPAYSPDFSPMELAFSKIKEYLNGLGARSRESLLTGLETALGLVKPAEAAAYFEHCGYMVAAQ